MSTGAGIGGPAFDLGFAAFVERNRPRYLRYAEARLSPEKAPQGVAGTASAAAVVSTTLVSARKRWGFILSQPCPAAEVWQELRIRVGREADRTTQRNPALAELYRRLPDGHADSVVLYCRLGFGIDEAAELMGTEPPAVATALTVVRRALPNLMEGRRP
ncbi:hypothetical protein RM717_33080 [Streptomyces griseus]|uniref:RNA polymerase sigma factor 70 region 4 type 2 domain-containing protein n=1 Tax=Streptomyces stephensoniae TaxID=3375367 RepID=A0ABU2WCT7_9ACTN|nr:hypothetical protein [Streptomyces griseus]MDT0495325.1 hypothetical protein [Streptomyces griseus]